MGRIGLSLLVGLSGCAAAPLYEAQTLADERPIGLEVLSGDACPLVRLRAGAEDWKRIGEGALGETLSREVTSPDCACAFDQDEPFVPADHFDLTEARAACEAARSES